MKVIPGEASQSKQESLLEGGIYTLDTSEYDFTFDEVLLELHLDDRTFTLKCFDGSVVQGSLYFEEDRLICTHADGKMMFTIHTTVDGNCLVSTRASVEKGALAAGQLMFCPQPGRSMEYTFCYSDDQSREIHASPEVIPLDSYKHLFKKIYQFQCYAEPENRDRRCVFYIYHYPLSGQWKFEGASKAKDVFAEENTEGVIVFSLDGQQWTFHREGENIVYDGGSPLIAGSWVTEENRYLEADVPVNAMFHAFQEDHVYDALYILPAETLEKAYASIQIDTKNQYLWIRCCDGNVLEGPYTYENNYINFPCEVMDVLGPQIVNVAIFPNEHCLTVSNQGARDRWELVIGPGEISDSFHFIPVIGVEPAADVEQ